MNFFAEIGVALVTCLIWAVIVVFFLRLFKIDARLTASWRSPLLRCPEIRNRSKALFVLVYGVVVWGWGMFVAMTALNYVAVHYFHESGSQMSHSTIAIRFVVFSVLGILVGFSLWGRKISPDSTSISSDVT